MHTHRTSLRLAVCVMLLATGSAGWCQAPAEDGSTDVNLPRSFRVGGASADITPTEGMLNYNGDPLALDKDAAPLGVQAVVLDDGTINVAILSVDCTFLGRTEVLRMRDALRRQLGWNPDHVCIAATHSHATPATTASFLTGSLPDPKYIDLLIEQACRAVGEAKSRLQPARLVAASIDAPPIGVCRRRIDSTGQAYMTGTEPSPSLPAESEIDRKMQYVIFEDARGKPLAAMFNFACHNNMVSRVFSADMFGRAGEYLRQKLGDVAVVTLAAPSGDVAYRLPGGKRTFKDDRAAGRAIADAILQSYPEQTRHEGGRFVVRSVVRQITDRPYDPKTYVYDNGRGANAEAREFFRKRYEPEEVAVRGRGATECDVEFQAIAFGDVAIVTNPAELFSIYGVKIREQSPLRVTLVSSLTNGYCGYVPTPEAFAHGGYETYRTVYTSRLAKDAGEQILRESVELLRSVRAR